MAEEKNKNEEVLEALDPHEEDYDRWGSIPGAITFIDPDKPDKDEKED